MRSVLALGLLVAPSSSAEAASRQHVFIRRDVASSFAAVPGWTGGRLRPLIHYGDTPGYNDPSRFGGGEALSVR